MLEAVLFAFEKVCIEQDIQITPTIAAFLTARGCEDIDDCPRSFRMGVRLAWLALHAVYGYSMKSTMLESLRQSPACGLTALCTAHRARLALETAVEQLGDTHCRFLDPALPADEYIPSGREQEAAAAMRKGGKLWICGPGGIGKTELVRQCMAVLVRDRIWRRICWVQYDVSLGHSFLKSFSFLENLEEKDAVKLFGRRLTEWPGRTLLLIDELDMRL